MILLISNIALFGQAPGWLWAKGTNSAGYNWGKGISVDANGDSYMTGFFATHRIVFGTDTLINDALGIPDFFVVKHDAMGNVLWAKSAGGTSDDMGNSICTDANGNSYVTGYFASPTITFGTIILTNGGSKDIFVVKYDAWGNVLWAKSAGGTSDEIGNSINIDANGNSYVTGYFISPVIIFGNDTLTNTSSTEDIYLVKYDASGNVLWAKSAVGTNDDKGNGICVDEYGNSYITGDFSSPTIIFDTITLTNSDITGSGDIFVMKYDTYGSVIWAKSAGGTGNDVGNSICVDVNGNACITGYFFSSDIIFGTTALTNASANADIWVVKYNNLGDVIWAKRAGGINYDSGNCIGVDVTGNFYITGGFQSPSIIFGTDTLINSFSGMQNFFVFKYDTSGNALWTKGAVSSGGNYSNAGFSIGVDANGNSYIAGYFASSTIIFGTDTLTNISIGIPNYFIAKLNNVAVGIKEYSVLLNEINIYPNPANDKVIIYFPAYSENYNAKIEILSVDGKILKINPIQEKTTHLDISDLSMGFFFIRTTNNGSIIVKRIIKEK